MWEPEGIQEESGDRDIGEQAPLLQYLRNEPQEAERLFGVSHAEAALGQNQFAAPMLDELIELDADGGPRSLGDRVVETQERGAGLGLFGAQQNDPVAVRETHQHGIGFAQPGQGRAAHLGPSRLEAKLLRHAHHQ